MSERVVLAVTTGAILGTAGCMGNEGSATLMLKYQDDVGLTDCVTIDFDTAADGAAIAPGDILDDAYTGIGMEIRAWRNEAMTKAGLPVAFDSNNPTGGDEDLAFSGQGNLLISQERFTDQDIANGFVSEPDDNGGGANFEFAAELPFCAQSLTFLDIDKGEVPTRIRLYDASGDLVGEQSVPAAGDNTRQEVLIEAASICDVVRMTVELPGSGALDDLMFCPNQAPEQPDDPIIL